MKKACLLLSVCCLAVSATVAQYAPQAGLPGSTAIDAGSSMFVAWATGCTVQRGYMDIANPSLGYARAGDSSLGIGPADRNIVSLGDSGVAVLTFAHPLYDGPGADFAVFENGFLNTANDSEAFLELAFVEVSSDGINYFRFPATSLTQYNTQVGNGDYLNATKLDNLAGKYIMMYGTPFDLQQMAGIAGLDINHVTHIRLTDVVGSVLSHASHDDAGRVINDPYPTPFPSCGFDLDAVGVINQVVSGVGKVASHEPVAVYPNPATDRLYVVPGSVQDRLTAVLTTTTGNVLLQTTIAGSGAIVETGQYPAGTYFLVLTDSNGNKWSEIIIKR